MSNQDSPQPAAPQPAAPQPAAPQPAAPQPAAPRARPPSMADIREFARRSNALNLDVSVGTLMEHMSVLEPRDVAAAGWGIVNSGFGIVTGGQE